VAASADEAVEALAGHAPQVLVLDVRMPGHDGLWLAREVRARHPETALVMISGDPQAGRELALARLGTFDYLSKPFTVDQIIQAVDCGTRWHEARLLELRTAHPTDAAQPPAGPAARPGPLMRSSRAAWAPSGAALSRLLADLVQA
jgi:DNA-binding NtrC family response regulator